MRLAIAIALALLGACDVECPICETSSETLPQYNVIPCGRAPTYVAFEDVLIDGPTSTVRVSFGSWNQHMAWAVAATRWSECIEKLRATGQ